jgi:hypothetical protein
VRYFKNWLVRRLGPGSAKPSTGEIIDIRGLAEAYERELALRHRPEISKFAFSDHRSGPSTLLATTAAVNIRAILGKDVGSFGDRAAWADHIASFNLHALHANGVQDPEHALCMAIQALNLLGTVPSLPAHCFASRELEDVDKLIANHSWRSTHKALWGKVAPLLASGMVDADWRARLFDAIGKRLQDSRGRVHFGLDRAAAGHRTISVLYHLGMIYDSARAPYPFARQMAFRLLDLDWPSKRRSSKITLCSDADWAWLLMVLARQEPEVFPAAYEAIANVARARAVEWNSGTAALPAMSTHHLYCHLWSTALYQDLCRVFFRGPYIPDTLNVPSLFRIRLEDADQ